MLQVLPTRISNLIAAGEVVQRPASVVKELLENAVDAGAGRISVEIADAGKTLIRITDDGCGMKPEDCRLAFERHATSKIAEAEDLNAIRTFGFRGEALPSIAAVADVTLRSRTADEETGSETHFCASEFQGQETVACPAGTSVCVRNLFFNVPARRKFLKADSTEFRAILQEFSRVALSCPGIAFRLTHNGKDIYQLRECPNRKLRIRDLAGHHVVQELIDVEVDTSVVRIQGYIGVPEEARKNQQHQYLFINGRYFQSRYLFRAIAKAYEKIIPEDHVPAYFLYLECDPAQVDINIHPAKTEVKFEDEALVFDILNAAVRESLGKNVFGPSIDFDTADAPEIPVFDRTRPVTPPKMNFDPLFNPFESEHVYSSRMNGPEAGIPSTAEETVPAEPAPASPVDGYGELFREESYGLRPLLQLHQKYILTPIKSGLMLVHIARARERIFYERYRNALQEHRPLSQETLFPLQVETDAATLELLESRSEQLRRMGFDIRSFGRDSAVIHAYPDGFPVDIRDGKAMLDEVLSLLEQPESEWAVPMASFFAGSTPGPANPIEAQLLVDSLFACAEPNYSPRGKRCLTKITMEDLDRLL